MNKVKQENFIRIADNRTNRIVELISKLDNLSNSSFYEYTDKQMDMIFDKIQAELNKQKRDFKKNKKRLSKRIEL